jgi:hypothetical protein
MKGTGATARSTDEASSPGLTVPCECGVGVVVGAPQQQAATEHEPECGRGGCGRARGVCACERAQRERELSGRGVCVPVRELSGGDVGSHVRTPEQQRGEDGWCWRELGVVRGHVLEAVR